MAAENAAAAGESAGDAFDRAHQVLLKTRGIQFDFTVLEAPKPPPWLKPLMAFIEAIGPFLIYVFWGGLILGALLILWFLVREFVPDRWFRRKIEVGVTDWRPDPGRARALLEEADRLAAEGRFEEAIHILLFRSIDDLVAHRPGAVKPALTSRDIAVLEVLPERARGAFTRLAQSVERTFFGGRPAGAEEFGAARADYRAFAEGWG